MTHIWAYKILQSIQSIPTKGEEKCQGDAKMLSTGRFNILDISFYITYTVDRYLDINIAACFRLRPKVSTDRATS